MAEENEAAGDRQIFVFELDGEEYAVEIDQVREIVKAEEKEITPVPNVPDFIRGITNIRGQVVPLIDLEARFNLQKNKNRFIVIIEVDDTPAGMLVDDVQEVIRISEKNIKESPRILEEEIHAEYIKEVAVLGERLIIILDLEKGLGEEESLLVEELSQKMSEDEEEEEEREVSSEEVEELAKERLES